MQRGFYPEDEAAHVARQILSAIEYLHSNGIAPRDLKPENLISSGYGKDEIVKLTDFGFSKIFLGDSDLKTSVGSPGYAAPELFTDGKYDKSVDMWSFGVIIYVLLAGYPPFYGETVLELIESVTKVEYDFDADIWDNISEEAKDLISNLLVKDTNRRYGAQQCKTHPWIMEEISDN